MATLQPRARIVILFLGCSGCSATDGPDRPPKPIA